MKLLETASRESLSILNDPFSKEGITDISTHCYKSLFNGDWKYTGRVCFKNGSTSGEQEFKAKSFSDLLIRVQEFINSL